MAEMNRPELPKLSDSDWKLLEVVAQVLCSFEQASRSLCASTYPTLSRVVPFYNFLLSSTTSSEGFLGMRDSEEEGRESQPSSMHGTRLASVFSEMPSRQPTRRFASATEGRGQGWMDAVSVILDPRLKMLYCCDGSGWEAEHIAYAKDALLQVADEGGTTASPVDIATCPGDWRLERAAVQKWKATPC